MKILLKVTLLLLLAAAKTQPPNNPFQGCIDRWIKIKPGLAKRFTQDQISWLCQKTDMWLTMANLKPDIMADDLLTRPQRGYLRHLRSCEGMQCLRDIIGKKCRGKKCRGVPKRPQTESRLNRDFVTVMPSTTTTPIENKLVSYDAEEIFDSTNVDEINPNTIINALESATHTGNHDELVEGANSESCLVKKLIAKVCPKIVTNKTLEDVFPKQFNKTSGGDRLYRLQRRFLQRKFARLSMKCKQVNTKLEQTDRTFESLVECADSEKLASKRLIVAQDCLRITEASTAEEAFPTDKRNTRGQRRKLQKKYESWIEKCDDLEYKLSERNKTFESWISENPIGAAQADSSTEEAITQEDETEAEEKEEPVTGGRGGERGRGRGKGRGRGRIGVRRKAKKNNGRGARSKRQSFDNEPLLDIGDVDFRAQRKEYRSMSDEERQRFHAAMNVLKSDLIDGQSKYDLIVIYHTPQESPGAHWGPAFLPFHRELLKQLEIALRLVDPDVHLPYWDSTLDQGLPKPSDSILWTEEFFGNDNGEVTVGPFAGWDATHPLGFVPNMQKLFRDVGTSPFGGLYKEEDIEFIMTRAYYEDLTACVDPTFELVHGLVHMFVGGYMADIAISPNDPAFFLHHVFIDNMWEEWRKLKQTPQERETHYPPDDKACNEFHYGEKLMRPFSIKNIDGHSNNYTRDLYYYYPRPTCSDTNPDCASPYLYCDIKRYKCMSTIRMGGNCTGFEGTRICANGICNPTGKCVPLDESAITTTVMPSTTPTSTTVKTTTASTSTTTTTTPTSTSTTTMTTSTTTPATTTTTEAPFSDDSCRRFANGPLCEGRGFCQQGYCVCHAPHVTGNYCECDNQACPLVDGLLCDGNGRCLCGQCQCDADWEGAACQCPTSTQTCQNDSGRVCSDHGRCDCGQCTCDQGWTGKHCNCSTSPFECFTDGGSICNGNGLCQCGKCDCNAGFSGDKCECTDNTDTCLAQSGLLCSGHGACNCGQCTCEPGWNGAHCDCPESEHTCVADNGQLCNGHGQCSCGQCQCDWGWIGDTCDCPSDESACIDDNGIFCSGHGTCDCGQCTCQDGWTGDKCDCPLSTDTCMDAKGLICGGYGTCECGFCVCDNGWSGPTCSQCPPNEEACYGDNGNICSGNGQCECGQCICQQGWTGDKCDCSSREDTCMGINGLVCSGHGTCECGQCQCDANYGGDQCQVCTGCSSQCFIYKPCVMCTVFESGPYSTSECSEKCNYDIVSVSNLPSDLPSLSGCEFVDPKDDCTFTFSIDFEQNGATQVPVVYVLSSRDCPTTTTPTTTTISTTTRPTTTTTVVQTTTPTTTTTMTTAEPSTSTSTEATTTTSQPTTTTVRSPTTISVLPFPTLPPTPAYPVVYFTITVIRGTMVYKQPVLGATVKVCGLNVPTGYTQALEGRVMRSPAYPEYTGGAVVRAMDPAKAGYFPLIQASVEVYDEMGRACQAHCYQASTKQYRPCRSRIRLSTNSYYGDPIQYRKTEMEAMTAMWSSGGYYRRRLPDYLMFKCQ